MAYTEKNINALVKRIADFKLKDTQVVAVEGEPITVVSSNELCTVGFYLPFLSTENKISNVLSIDEVTSLGSEQKPSFLKTHPNTNFRWSPKEGVDINKALSYLSYRANTYPDSKDIEYIEVKQDSISYISSYQVRTLYSTNLFDAALPIANSIYLSIDSIKVISKFIKLYKVSCLYLKKEEHDIYLYTDKGYIVIRAIEEPTTLFKSIDSYDNYLQLNQFNYEYLTDSDYLEMVNSCSVDGLINFTVNPQPEYELYKEAYFYKEVFLLGNINYPKIEAKETDLSVKMLSKLVSTKKILPGSSLDFTIKYLDLYKALGLLNSLSQEGCSFTLAFSDTYPFIRLSTGTGYCIYIPIFYSCLAH